MVTMHYTGTHNAGCWNVQCYVLVLFLVEMNNMISALIGGSFVCHKAREHTIRGLKDYGGMRLEVALLCFTSCFQIWKCVESLIQMMISRCGAFIMYSSQ